MKAKIALLVSLLALAPSAFAISYAEVGDAGQTVATAQNTGSGALTSITGFGGAYDVDFFNIYSTGGFFSASTSSSSDPMLFLWDATGNPLLFNDDWFSLQSYITTNLSAGSYILGISRYSNGFGMHHADINWGSDSRSLGSYTIHLQGANGAGVPDGASTFALFGLALAGLAWVRRFSK
jgi:hypothetical protein